jgi:predicted membrane protein
MERNNNNRLYFGIILISVGVALILEKLGFLGESVSDVLISWQMLLVAIGAISFFGSNRTSGIILMTIGGVFLIPEIFTVTDEMRKIFWPLILVAIGVTILLRQLDRKSLNFINKGRNDQGNNSAQGQTTSDSSNYFDDFVIFGGKEMFINSPALSGGKATTIFGGMEYDLRRATLQQGGAVIDCVSIFGGCGFKIPMDWNVRNEVTAVFGGFTDKRGDTYNDRYYDPAKTIVIKGVSIFGGIEVKHF